MVGEVVRAVIFSCVESLGNVFNSLGQWAMIFACFGPCSHDIFHVLGPRAVYFSCVGPLGNVFFIVWAGGP